MSIFYDQLNRAVELNTIPQKIISVVPSQTELLFSMGLCDEVIGVTKFCIHPRNLVSNVIRIGGTKQLDIAKIISLQPDLIIANKEENDRDQIEQLMKLFPVWISDISNLTEALDMIGRVGALVHKTSEATELIAIIASKFAALKKSTLGIKIAYFIWRKPHMAAGRGTFIDDMLQACGLKNAFELARYPEISTETLVAAQPDVVFLSSEPYPFNSKHVEEFRTLLPNAIIRLVDGEMFSWYGSRLTESPVYFERLLNDLPLA